MVDEAVPTRSAHAGPGPAPATAPHRRSRRPTLSFELMPPRRPEVAPRFWETARRLVAVHPDFVSVTYGAGGGDRATARAVLRTLLAGTPVLPVAHLTCVGASREDVRQVVADYLDAGVRAFLALRGDPPHDQPDWRPAPGGVTSSVELVRLLREVEADRAADDAGAALRGAAHPLAIAVAAFPNGNPAAGTTRAQEVRRLLDKQRAGASFAITQLFYEAAAYVDFLADARAAGVTIPVLAGLLPATEPRRLHRVEELTGVAPPPELLERLEALGDPEAQHLYGVARSVEVAQAVLDAGAPGLHVYTFNKHRPALDLLAGVGLVDPVLAGRASAGEAAPVEPLAATALEP